MDTRAGKLGAHVNISHASKDFSAAWTCYIITIYRHTVFMCYVINVYWHPVLLSQSQLVTIPSPFIPCPDRAVCQFPWLWRSKCGSVDRMVDEQMLCGAGTVFWPVLVTWKFHSRHCSSPSEFCLLRLTKKKEGKKSSFSDGDFLIPITPVTLKINMNFVKQLYKLYTFYNVTAFIASRPVAGWRSARGLWGQAWRRWSQRSCCETLALCAPPDPLHSWTAVSPQPAGAGPPALRATAETGQFEHKAVTSWCRPSSTECDSWNRSILTQSCNQLVQTLQHRVWQLKQVNFNTKL